MSSAPWMRDGIALSMPQTRMLTARVPALRVEGDLTARSHTLNPVCVVSLTHNAVIMPGPREPLRIATLPTPYLEPGAALLRTLYSEVCGTDVHLHHGKLDVPFPIIPGHVSVGVVEASGGKLKDINGQTIK